MVSSAVDHDGITAAQSLKSVKQLTEAETHSAVIVPRDMHHIDLSLSCLTAIDLLPAAHCAP